MINVLADIHINIVILLASRVVCKILPDGMLHVSVKLWFRVFKFTKNFGLFHVNKISSWKFY